MFTGVPVTLLAVLASLSASSGVEYDPIKTTPQVSLLGEPETAESRVLEPLSIITCLLYTAMSSSLDRPPCRTIKLCRRFFMDGMRWVFMNFMDFMNCMDFMVFMVFMVFMDFMVFITLRHPVYTGQVDTDCELTAPPRLARQKCSDVCPIERLLISVLPASIIIAGAGAIGVEFAYVMRNTAWT